MATPVLPARVVNYTGAGPHILDAFAQNAVVVVTHGSAAAVHLPDEDAVNFPIGTQITIVQGGAGTVTTTAPGDAAIAGPAAATVSAADTALLVKYAADTWAISVQT